MKYSDPMMERYFNALPAAVRRYIDASGVEISTYGELMQIGEHFRHSLGCAEERSLY